MNKNIYERGQIYKLVNDELGLTYYGSTVNALRKRLAQHKSGLNCSSKILFQDESDVKIYLVEECSFNSKIQLKQRERYFIENNICVNKNIPSRTEKEYKFDNKEKIKESKKQYRSDNEEQIKKYYQDNKEQKKQYYQDNKEVILEKQKIKYQCECGSKIRLYDKQQHNKTIKHQKYLKEKI